MAENEEERLKKKRSVVRSLTTKLVNKIEEIIVDDTEYSIDQKIELLDQNRDQLSEKAVVLKKLDNEIEILVKFDDLENEVITSEDYSEKIIKCKFKINKFLKDNADSRNEGRVSRIDGPSLSESRNNHCQETRKINLPKLEINKFSGNPVEWMEFYSQFESAIHIDDRLSNVDKMIYLRSLLIGSPAHAISAMKLSNENYEAAIQILKERFGRKDIIISQHMNMLLNLEPVKNSHNVNALRKLYDDCDVQIRSLHNLGVASGSFGQLLSPILLNLLPDDLAVDYNRKRKTNDWDVMELISFIKTEVECRESTNIMNELRKSKDTNTQNIPKYDSYKKKFQRNIPSAAALNTSLKTNCVFCISDTHSSESCQKVPIEEKLSKLKARGMCYLCFRRFHRAKDCRAKIPPCEHCHSKNHNKSICIKANSSIQSPEVPGKPAIISSCVPESFNNAKSSSHNLLQTCSARISSDFNSRVATLLFDNGSERSFVLKSLVQKLRLPVLRKENLIVYCFGSRKGEERSYDVVRFKLENKHDSKMSISIEALVTDVICGSKISVSQLNSSTLQYRNSADTSVTSETAEVLLGGDVFWEIVYGSPRRIGKYVFEIDTLLGQTIQGNLNLNGNESVQRRTTINLCANEALNDSLKNIWSLEAIGCATGNDDASEKEMKIISDFENGLKYVNGRYETMLLWNEDKRELQNNFGVAKQRFRNLHTKLENDSWVKERYLEVIEDQLKNDIAEICSDVQVENCYFMPHRAVVKRNKSTNVRIVFDASSSANNCKSLNDCLESGPNLNPNILDVILKFREKRIAFCADIEKAFLQIGISESDRNYLRFLWFTNVSDVNRYKAIRMKRLPFGVTSSPFILAATIKYHIRKYESKKIEAYNMLNTSLYVDDLFYGTETVREAYNLSCDAINIFNEAGMNLRKFKTNSKELKDLWANNNFCRDNCELNIDNPLKVLGIIWDEEEDILKLDIQPLLESMEKLKGTKRQVIRTAAKIFDPIGFITPFLIRVKCIFQDIWEKGVEWDEELPEDINVKFKAWCSEIESLKEFSIPRTYVTQFVDTGSSKIQLHIFCDASPRAFGAIAYFRWGEQMNKISCNFVMSRARVAPLKRLTLPRLELTSGVIAARMAKYLKNLFKLSDGQLYLWSDSAIALHWIKGSARNWKPYVSNRVEEIQTLTNPENWRHCRGKDNPADLLTKGEKVKALLNCKVWWHGPEWLLFPNNLWPPDLPIKVEAKINDERKVQKETFSQLVCNVTSTTSPVLNLENYSKLLRLYRVTAWIRRFLHNMKPGVERLSGSLTARELADAEIYWIRNTQKGAFSQEIQLLKRGQNIEKSSKIYQFHPELDENELLIVKGRLQFSHLDTRGKHPWILPPQNKFVELLILDVHCKIFHQGVNATLVAIREKVWILRARQVIKSVLRKCLICRKFSCPRGTQEVAPLPANRIQESPPFNVTGLDFAGPVFTRGADNKHYILLCTCAVTRAVHLELVSSLSTETFLLAFRRFIARRGLCTVVYSDNAKTFKRADLELRHIWKIINHPEVKDYYSSKGIQWKFIIERGAWWGGFWERMVRTVKACLKKTLGKTSLSTEELETLLVEIEASVNTRPITYVYDDLDEPSPLTPAHFLLGKRLMHLPHVKLTQPDLQSSKDCSLKRYFYQNKLLNHFWKRWREEYLMNLRSANTAAPAKTVTEFKVGDVVLINDNRYPRHMWNLGKVMEIFLGRDGKVRSCAVKTKSGILKRPIQLLHNLELDNV